MIESWLPNYIQILIFILLFEIFLVLFLLFTIFLVGIWQRYQERWQKEELRKLSQAILNYMKNKISLDEVQKKSKISYKRLLLEELERFNQRFSGEEWQSVRNKIVDQYLINPARKLKGSKNWKKRIFAARTFSLNPQMRDKEAILSLMDDPVFLVHTHVIPAVMELNIKDGVIKILKLMSKETGYSYYYYRDTLLSGTAMKDFQWIEEVASGANEIPLQLACLDVLSGKMLPLAHNFLLKDLKSTNPAIKLAALKVFANNPQKDSLAVLTQHVTDSNEEIRSMALSGLRHFRSLQTLTLLENALNDSSWKVRTEAALALKEMGRLGHEILEKQNPELNKRAYEVAHYTLQLDW